MATRPRTEITYDDLRRVLGAAAMLRAYNLITPAHARVIRGNVHADVQTLLKRLRGQMTPEQFDHLTDLSDSCKPL
jgi:hypothetical protein